MQAFSFWAEKFVAATPDEKEALLAEGEDLAAWRAADLYELMKADPEKALTEAVPYDLRKALPESIEAFLEESVSGRGNLRAFVLDSGEGSSAVIRQMEADGRAYDAHVYGWRARQRSGNDVPFHGIAIGERLAVDARLVRVLSRSEKADRIASAKEEIPWADANRRKAASDDDSVLIEVGGKPAKVGSEDEATDFDRRLVEIEASESGLSTSADANLSFFFGPSSQGRKRFLYIRVNFPDDPREPVSESQAYDIMSDVSQFFADSSYNTLNISATVTPVLTLPQPKEFYRVTGATFDSRFGNIINDARVVARAAGYIPDEFELQMVHAVTVPGFPGGGLFSIFGRDNLLQGASASSIARGLGFNFGLSYANAWNTRDEPRTIDGDPYPPNPRAPNANYPIHIDSQIGRDGINVPGRSHEEQDPFDQMGQGGVPEGHFNAISKARLGWLPAHALGFVNSSATNRVYAFDSPERVEGRLYGLVVRKNLQRNYWVQFRHLWTNNVWLSNGIELHWPSIGPFDPDDTGSTDLIDTTPGSARGMNDSAIVVGRTFTDEEANLHITPFEKGGTGREQWIDVVVNVGPFRGNRAPSFNLTASALSVAINSMVTFTADASDPDLDRLSYFWEENNVPLATNAPVITRRFTSEGYYVLRCEVSDMKGGKTIRHLVVTVGTPSNFLMSGRVIDPQNQPVPGVRVHNGRLGAGYRVAFTDSDGGYTITDVDAGNYDNLGFLYGYKTDPLTFYNPITISGANAANLDHLAFPIAKVSVSVGKDADEDDDEESRGTFIVTRTGDTSSELVVPFVLTGRASPGADYQPPSSNAVVFLAGETEQYVDIPSIPDDVGEGPESVTMALDLQTSAQRVITVLTNMGGTNVFVTITNDVFFRGYELLVENGNYSWHQTYPFYVLGSAEATLNIVDRDPPGVPSVSLNYFFFIGSGTAFESGNGSAVVYVSRVGNLSEPLTVFYRLGGTATNGADYMRLPGRITIPAGQEVVVLPIVPLDDSLVEGTESVTIDIVSDPTYTGGGNATVSIVDDDLPLITLMTPDDVASEAGANSAVFRVVRAGDLSQELQVFYQITGGTATEGADFVPLSRSVIVPAGQNSIDFLVIPIPDVAAEGNETLMLLLADATTYNIGSPNSATITIRDLPLPVVTLDTTDPDATEGSTGLFTLTRTGPTTNSLTVSFAVGGTATPADYAAIGTNVTFAPGATTATVTISAIDDRAREALETVIVRLLPGPPYNLGTAIQGEVTIEANDSSELPEVTFTAQRGTVPEAGGSAAKVLVHLSNSIGSTNRSPVQVGWRVVSGSAIRGADYTLPSSGYLTFVYDEPSVQSINVNITNDGEAEPTETIVLGLFDPDLVVTNYVTVTNGMTVTTNEVLSRVATNAFLGPYRTHTLSILDDDLSVVSISVADGSAAETAQDPASFVISRTGSTNTAQTVFFSVGGSAAHGSDYSPIGTSITIPAGANSVTLFILPADDPQEEFDESVSITLVRAPGAQIGNAFGFASIRDNDGSLQFLTSVFQVAENAGEALISVVRTRDTNRFGRVEFQIFDGTATRSQDYLATNGFLEFLPGDVQKTISVQLLNDNIVEPDETVLFVLTNATGGVPIGGQRTATLFINNDDSAYDFATNTFYVNENAGAANIIVYRSGLADTSSTIEFSAATNSAASPTDFAAVTNRLLTFGVGETSKVVSVTINNDTLFEGNETVALTLTNPGTNTVLGPNSAATLVIRDDESSLAFSAPTFSTNEFAPYVSVVVTRTGGTVNPVSVNFATSDGTATNALDYIAQQGRVDFAGDGFVLLPGGSGQVQFRPGETNKTIQIPLLDDTIGEGTETFTIALSNAGTTASNTPPGSTVLGRDGAPTSATVRILDNESPGGIDYEYDPGAGANGPVYAVALQDDKVVFGGAFDAVDGVNFTRIARLHRNGALDISFNPGSGANGDVLAIATHRDGWIYIGGMFSSVGGVDRSRIARLNANGAVDGFIGSGANGTVRALAVQANGQVLVGGDFSQINGVPRSRLARLNSDGTVDGNFAPAVSGPVNAIAVQPDGNIVIGGNFTDVAGRSRAGVARLRPTGAVDLDFDPRGGASGAVNAIAVVSGKVVVAGAFTSFDGAPRGRLARLNSDGSLDVAFASGAGANGTVLALGVNASGRVAVGGEFTTIDGVSRNRFARLRIDGSVDASFDPGSGADAPVRALAVQQDTAIVIGGDFTTINGVPRNRIARIHGDERSNTVAVDLANSSISVIENAGPAQVNVVRIGNADLEFSVTLIVSNSAVANSATPGVDFVATNLPLVFARGEVSKFVNIPIIDDTQIEPDEYIRVWFTNASANVDLSGSSSGTITIVDNEQSFRFSTDRFDISESQPFASVTVLREGLRTGTVSVGFSATNGTATAPGDFVATNRVLTFTNGEASKTIQLRIIQDRNQEPVETVQISLSNPVGGGLGTPASALLYINDDVVPGTIDMTFDPGLGANGRVRAMILTPDGKVVLGGSFNLFNGTNRNFLARIHPDGAHDLTFNAGIGPNAVVLSLGTLSDGRLIVGGGFTAFNTNTAYRRLVRLSPNGALDLNFQPPNFNAAVNALAVHGNNHTVVGGGFSSPSRSITQLRLDGSTDISFNPGAGAFGPVHAAIAMPDRRVIIGGAFAAVDIVSTRSVARLHTNGVVDGDFVVTAITNGAVLALALQPDRKVIVAGDFFLNTSGARVNVARLNTDGSLDSAFNAAAPNGPIYAVGLQRDGKIIIGGDFTSVGGVARGRYARLLSNGELDSAFSPGPGADAPVYSILVMPDDNTLIAGDFQNVNGLPRPGVARIRTDDGEIRITTVRHLGSELRLNVTSNPGITYILEISTDLSNWAPVTTNTAPGTTLEFIDPALGGTNQKFYRVRQGGF